MAFVKLVQTDCWCGMPFSMPERLYDECYKNGKDFYCPLGHRMAFKETENDQLRRERDRLRQNEARLEELVDEERRRANAYKGHLTRTKKRVAAGVCPCCNRSFQNLHRHMETKHPDYLADDKVVSIDEAKSA